MSDRYLKVRDLLKRLPISRPTIYRMVKRGEMPKPLKLGSSTVWLESEITEWERGLASAR